MAEEAKKKVPTPSPKTPVVKESTKKDIQTEFPFDEKKKEPKAKRQRVVNAKCAYDYPNDFPILQPEDLEEIENFVKSENIFNEIDKDYTTLGLIGEKYNKLLAYIAATSRLLDTPLNILVTSESGAGKSALQNMTLKLMPPEGVIRTSSITDKALYYKGTGLLKNKILALEEAAGIADMYSIRTMLTEKHLTIETVQGGKTKTNVVEGPVSMFMTTTDQNINPETKSRFFVFGVDQSQSQTSDICKSQRKSYTLAGLQQKAGHQKIINKHHNFQRLLKNFLVVIPDAENLCFDDNRLQARRDQEKFLNLVCAVAFVRQMNKPIKNFEGRAYIEADEDDVDIAVCLASEVMGFSLNNLSTTARDLLKQLLEMVNKDATDTDRLLTRVEIMKATGRSSSRLSENLKELMELGLVQRVGKKDGCDQYKLIYAGGGEQGEKFLFGYRNRFLDLRK